MKEDKKRRNHRYYLHRKVKLFTDVKARTREVAVNDEIINNCTKTQRRHLSELSLMGYNLQTFIK